MTALSAHAGQSLPALRRTQAFGLPTRVLQFGQGNFLRGFFDWQIDILNERCGLNAGVVIVRPTTRSNAALLDTQGGLYTTVCRGVGADGQVVQESRLIQCVQRELDLRTMWDDYLALARNPDIRFVVSNTTEAGIAVNTSDAYTDVPPSSFPAKLTRWLHARFVHFGGDARSGLIFLPMELIDHNGEVLKLALKHFAQQWSLGAEFMSWLDQACFFCSTLVDRIVPGYPAPEAEALCTQLGYRDAFLVATELYHLLLIQGPPQLKEWLHLDGSQLNIQLVDDIRPYKLRKVGVLNGAHTVLVPVALLAGASTVGEAIQHPDLAAFLHGALHEEIIPSLDLPQDDLLAYAQDVVRRFQNPFIHHRLESIALNSWPKLAVRVMPQLLRYLQMRHTVPPKLVLAVAATAHLYRGRVIQPSDDASHLAFFQAAWQNVYVGQWSLLDLATAVLARHEIWGQDLSHQPGLVAALAQALNRIERLGVVAALQAPERT